jgi:hypothetical protein
MAAWWKMYLTLGLMTIIVFHCSKVCEILYRDHEHIFDFCIRHTLFYVIIFTNIASSALASSKIALHWSRSCVFRLQFLTPIIFRSSSIESSHLIAGLPTGRVPSDLWTVNFLQGFGSCILERCPSHLNLPGLITFIISILLYNWYNSRLYLYLHVLFSSISPYIFLNILLQTLHRQ